MEALRKIPGVGMISENVRQGITFSLRASGERTLGVHFIGVDQYFAETYSLELVAGRMMSEEDVRGHRRICMLAVRPPRICTETPPRLWASCFSWARTSSRSWAW